MKRYHSHLFLAMATPWLLASYAYAQEIEGPPHPSIDLWTGCCERSPGFDSDERNERERSTRTDQDRIEESVKEQLARELPNMCVVVPVPLEVLDNYVGVACLYHFEPNPVYVEEWDGRRVERRN